MEIHKNRGFSYRSVPAVGFDNTVIDVEFLVLHYTGGSLRRSLELFLDPQRKVSAHLLIAPDGEVVELVPCLDGKALQAWHAGESMWDDGKKLWSGFNAFSIGIEMVNVHGNFFQYTFEQYRSLTRVINYLKRIYPKLESANRLVGHEHIAGWRGKADPGSMFEWERIFSGCYSGQKWPAREPIMPGVLKTALEKFLPFEPKSEKEADEFWHAMNYTTETAIRLAHGNG
jgi:N-acetyl-anhydromuramyl-L-alanine amidase AmpD